MRAGLIRGAALVVLAGAGASAVAWGALRGIDYAILTLFDHGPVDPSSEPSKHWCEDTAVPLLEKFKSGHGIYPEGLTEAIGAGEIPTDVIYRRGNGEGDYTFSVASPRPWEHPDLQYYSSRSREWHQYAGSSSPQTEAEAEWRHQQEAASKAWDAWLLTVIVRLDEFIEQHGKYPASLGEVLAPDKVEHIAYKRPALDRFTLFWAYSYYGRAGEGQIFRSTQREWLIAPTKTWDATPHVAD